MIRRALGAAWGWLKWMAVQAWTWVRWIWSRFTAWIRSLKEPAFSTWEVLGITALWIACMTAVWWVEFQSGEDARRLHAQALEMPRDTVVVPVTSEAFDMSCTFRVEEDDR